MPVSSSDHNLVSSCIRNELSFSLLVSKELHYISVDCSNLQLKFRTFTSKGTHYYEGKLNMSFCTIAEIIQEIAKPLAIKIMVWNKLDSGP